ncbi:MAG: hypothetical protein HQM09_24895 [Candidatus Riflebacteria bacterium]|nr:hypothetical protein [Candidatus Riflebacteria bacterium]
MNKVPEIDVTKLLNPLRQKMNDEIWNKLTSIDRTTIMESFRDAVSEGVKKAILLLEKPLLTTRELSELFDVSESHLRNELPKNVKAHFLAPPNSRNRRSRQLFARQEVLDLLERNSGPSLDVKRHLGGFLKELTSRKKI